MSRLAHRQNAARLSTILGAAIAVAGAAFVTSRLAADWNEVATALRGADVRWLIASAFTAAAGMSWVGASWSTCIHALGRRVGRAHVLYWYFVGQLGKYVPGGIWPMVGRAEMATRGGVPRAVAYNSVALSMTVTYLAAAAVITVLIPLGSSPSHDLRAVWWLAIMVPVGVIVLHPTVLGRILRFAERLLGDGGMPQIPTYSMSLKLIALHTPAWLMIGTATWMATKAIEPSAPFLQITAAGVLSWLVGFLALPVPGGLGVREATFIAAATSISPPVAATAGTRVPGAVHRCCDDVAHGEEGDRLDEKTSSPTSPPGADAVHVLFRALWIVGWGGIRIPRQRLI